MQSVSNQRGGTAVVENALENEPGAFGGRASYTNGRYCILDLPMLGGRIARSQALGS